MRTTRKVSIRNSAPCRITAARRRPRRLTIGSPAINTIPVTGGCNGAGVTVDQRGVARPFGPTCDIGAVEFAFAIIPSSGSFNGGTTLTIIGAGFVPGMTVTLGANTCTSPTITGTGTSATCTIPAHGQGTVDVTLTRNSQSIALTNGYTYGNVTVLPGPQPSPPPSGNPAPLPSARPPGEW